MGSPLRGRDLEAGVSGFRDKARPSDVLDDMNRMIDEAGELGVYLDDKRLRAVLALERALKRCAVLGVALFGMDDRLLALPREMLSDDDDLFRLQGLAIEHGGAYVDSGAS